MKNQWSEFKPTSWAINNKTSVYFATLLICIAGIFTYNNLPKEQFPEVIIPQIIVTTVYPGTSPTDMETVVAKVIEKEIKTISGVRKVTANCFQDFATIIVEFNTGISIETAKGKVKDAVDKARSELPNDLPQDPQVIEINLSDLPIMNINIAGDYDLLQLKAYADLLKDKIEAVKEINRVDIIGALEREVQINVDMYRMMSSGISFMDIENAIRYENMTISGGELTIDGTKWAVSVKGEFKDVERMKDLMLRSPLGGLISLKEIAEIKNGTKEQESYARLDHKNVITLNVIKRSGENLISASDKITEVLTTLKKDGLPNNLKITVTGDQSVNTRITLHDLINTIIIGFLLVTFVLIFFMGTTNAIFVGLSVPLSAFLSFLIMPNLGFTLNMIVLFGFLLALGIVVDDAVVVVENSHRLFGNGKVPIKKAVKHASKEVFLPVLTGTIVTLGPFIPLLFWPGIIGDFMKYLPITLIIMLTASLVVAYIINPVFAVDFMKPHDDQIKNPTANKSFYKTCAVFAGLTILAYFQSFGLGNFTLTIWALYVINKFIFNPLSYKFQHQSWPWVQEKYRSIVSYLVQGKRPIVVFFAGIGLLIFSFVITAIRQPKVDFFPTSEPNFVMCYIRMPIGTHQIVTDSVTKIVEDRVYSVIGDNNPIVNSVISNVAIGAGTQDDISVQAQSHLGKVTVAFVEFSKRGGQNTTEYLDKIREAVKGIPGAEISVDKEQNGPPTGKPINIEIAGDNFDELIKTSHELKSYILASNIGGIEELKSDFQSNKPEIVIKIDRTRANKEGLSTGQIGSELRTAIFGKEISKFRDDKDDYSIQLRFKEDQANDINKIMNMLITYRDMNMMGRVRQVPLSAVADIEYSNTYASIKRINKKRVITLASNVLSGYNANEVVTNITESFKAFPKPDAITIKMTGEQEQQAETSEFLSVAFMLAIFLILLVLVTQFNSTSKPLIILFEIIFSITGVLLGFAIFNMNISIVMTGVGIFALIGIIIRNGILLVEFTDKLLDEGMPLLEAVVEAGKTRMTPVILTALAAVLGLIPLAVGLNIDFVKLFTELNPHIFFGGDSVAFWGPLSWTMIFGIIFGTFLTLIMVPVMYVLNEKFKHRVFKLFGKEYTAELAAKKRMADEE